MKKFKRMMKRYYNNEIGKIQISEYEKVRSNFIIFESDKKNISIYIKNFIFHLSCATIMFFLFFSGFLYRTPLQYDVKEFYLNNKIEEKFNENKKQINSILLRIQKKYNKEI
jgi:hypothetical protein